MGVLLIFGCSLIFTCLFIFLYISGCSQIYDPSFLASQVLRLLSVPSHPFRLLFLCSDQSCPLTDTLTICSSSFPPLCSVCRQVTSVRGPCSASLVSGPPASVLFSRVLSSQKDVPLYVFALYFPWVYFIMDLEVAFLIFVL